MKGLIRMISGVFGKKASEVVEKKYASAYRFSDRMILYPQLQTPFGHFATEPFRVVGLDAGAEVVAGVVREVLAGSRKAPDSPHGKEMVKWYLQQMGVKSLKQLHAGTISVGVMMAEGRIEFSATHNGGSSGEKRGFRPIEGAKVMVASEAAAGEVAGGLMKAFGLCTRVF